MDRGVSLLLKPAISRSDFRGEDAPAREDANGVAPVVEGVVGADALRGRPVIHVVVTQREHAAEEAAIAKQLAADAEARKQLEVERAKELEFFGVQTRSVADVLVEAAVGPQAANVRAGALSLAEALDKEDRREQNRDEAEAVAYAAAQGKPPPRFDRWENKKNVAAYEREAETTPATKADLRELEGEITGLKSALHALKPKRRGSRSAAVPAPPGPSSWSYLPPTDRLR
jgi:hypothetical protein